MIRNQEVKQHNDWIFFGLGVAYFNEHKYEEAIQEFQKVVRINSLHDDAYSKIGLIQKQKGKN